ncbi:hypothetical protein CRUP_020891 [Coryphaenoides rupestris]|nr:hypothetical protein CRUP_020891 [Coryphaenoides rupestris]
MAPHLREKHPQDHAKIVKSTWTLDDLLSQLSLPEDQRQQEAEVVSMVTGGGARMELERSVDAPNNTPPRDRKAGCKNFYWKGFTSC